MWQWSVWIMLITCATTRLRRLRYCASFWIIPATLFRLSKYFSIYLKPFLFFLYTVALLEILFSEYSINKETSYASTALYIRIINLCIHICNRINFISVPFALLLYCYWPLAGKKINMNCKKQWWKDMKLQQISEFRRVEQRDVNIHQILKRWTDSLFSWGWETLIHKFLIYLVLHRKAKWSRNNNNSRNRKQRERQIYGLFKNWWHIYGNFTSYKVEKDLLGILKVQKLLLLSNALQILEFLGGKLETEQNKGLF